MIEPEEIVLPISKLLHTELPYWDDGEPAPPLRANYPPVIVTPMGNKGKYRLIDGYHRVGAAKAQGIDTIRAVVAPSNEWIKKTMADLKKESEVETFEILESRLEDLKEKVEKFQRKSAKLGLTPFVLNVVGEKLVPVYGPHVAGYEDEVIGQTVHLLVQVIGEAPVVAGHVFVARLEHTPAGSIMSKAPGMEGVKIPDMFLHRMTCDHCHTKRQRNDTFLLLRQKDNKIIQVGRNCLADYLRSPDALEVLNLWSFLHELEQASRERGEGNEPLVYPIEKFMATVSRAVELHGWTSAKVAREFDKRATGAYAVFACEPPPKRMGRGAGAEELYQKMLKEWKDLQPQPDDLKIAKLVIAWAKKLSGNSMGQQWEDYEKNLKVSCSLSYVKPKNANLVASAYAAYKRQVEGETKRAARAEQAAKSQYFGEIGNHYMRELEVKHINEFETEFGTTTLYSMVDKEGNRFKWFTKTQYLKWTNEDMWQQKPLAVKDRFWFVFTVKDHSEYKGAKDTVVTRASIFQEKPVQKWVNEATGEIFKTKKEMVAATGGQPVKQSTKKSTEDPFAIFNKNSSYRRNAIVTDLGLGISYDDEDMPV